MKLKLGKDFIEFFEDDGTFIFQRYIKGLNKCSDENFLVWVKFLAEDFYKKGKRDKINEFKAFLNLPLD